MLSTEPGKELPTHTWFNISQKKKKKKLLIKSIERSSRGRKLERKRLRRLHSSAAIAW